MVEFTLRQELKDRLFNMQHKIEDGVISMVIGDKAGSGLYIFLIPSTNYVQNSNLSDFI